LESPFNSEFESFVLEVRNLIVPILEGVDRHGLKARHLRKFQLNVDRFYKKHIVGSEYVSEATVKYQKRFQRYKESLFTFLDRDSVPWNNNVAERAIRHLAIQRKISGTFYKRLVRQYLLLLGIAQTCRFQGKSFLEFLLSKERDVNLFKASRPFRHSIPVTRELRGKCPDAI
jgi:Transposase IS66 family